MQKPAGICLLLCTFSCSLSLHAQQDSISTATEYYKMGMEVFDFTHRKQSTELFVLATKFDPKNSKAQFMAGKSIMLTIRKEESLPYFKKAFKLDPKVDDDILFYMGRGYQYSEKFDSAILFYEKYNQYLARTLNYEKSIKTTEINRKIFECRNAKIFKANPVDVTITDLSTKINSEWPDYAPNVNADETYIIFTSRRPDDNMNPSLAADHEYYEDIYYATSVNGEWQASKNIGPPLNTQYHNASINISPDGNEVYIYSDEHGGDILSSTRSKDGTWATPKSLEGINTQDIENSATVSKDGKRIFFTSNRPGTYGGTDIFTSLKDKNGKWSDIKNLGPVVNTEYDEEDVFISSNGKHLYFSSNGHAGMGDMDIYRSVYDSATGVWGAPENLGYPINSVENDIYFVLTGDEQHAYYSSVKKENKGEQDIYRIDMKNWKPIDLTKTDPVPPPPPPVEEKPAVVVVPFAKAAPAPTPKAPATIQLEIVVLDEETNGPAEAIVQLTAGKKPISSTHSGTGHYNFSWTYLPGTSVRYDLSVNRTGYTPQASPVYLFLVDPGGTQPLVIYDTVKIRKAYVKTGAPQVIPVLFASESDVPLSFEGVLSVEKMMKENPSIKVEIAGHTDDRGEADYNLTLSVRRADAVRDLLIKSGIDPARIAAAGYGEAKPMVSNRTEEGKKQNRRTEFTIIE